MSDTEVNDDNDVVKHPAKFSTVLLPVLADALQPLVDNRKFEMDTEDDNAIEPISVLDPFAGTGLIHRLRTFGPYRTIGIEIEPEWARMSPNTFIGNALALQFDANSFDAICTSPTYGNRFADKHNAKDSSIRRGYTHDLGRELHKHNSGGMQWGDKYRMFHQKAWSEALRVLRPGGLFVLNIKDHIRRGERQYVAGWHVTTLCRMGLGLLYSVDVHTPGLRLGDNGDKRVKSEQVFVFVKQQQPERQS